MKQISFMDQVDLIENKVRAVERVANDKQLTFSIKVPEMDNEMDSAEFESRFQVFHTSFMNIIIDRLGHQVSTVLNNTMDLSIWEWDRPTPRKSGPDAGSPRNLVDTGALKKSLFIATDADDHVSATYNSPYANMVHYGGYIQPYGNPNAASVYIPGRPWIKAAVRGSHGAPPPRFRNIVQTTLVEEWKAAFG